jgi:hypothetical protein
MPVQPVSLQAAKPQPPPRALRCFLAGFSSDLASRSCLVALLAKRLAGRPQRHALCSFSRLPAEFSHEPKRNSQRTHSGPVSYVVRTAGATPVCLFTHLTLPTKLEV